MNKILPSTQRSLDAWSRRVSKTQFFPTFLILLDLGAAFVYALEPDLRRAIYWFAAAVLTACVTY